MSKVLKNLALALLAIVRFWRIPLTPSFNLFLGVNLVGGGATIAFPRRARTSRFRQALFHYGGILAQGVLQAVLWSGRAWAGWDAAPLDALLLVNGATAAANLLPIRLRFRGLEGATDGALAAEVLGRGGVGHEVTAAEVAARARKIRPRLANAAGHYVLDACEVLSGRPLPAGFRWDRPVPAGVPPVYAEALDRAFRPITTASTGGGPGPTSG